MFAKKKDCSNWNMPHTIWWKCQGISKLYETINSRVLHRELPVLWQASSKPQHLRLTASKQPPRKRHQSFCGHSFQDHQTKDLRVFLRCLLNQNPWNSLGIQISCVDDGSLELAIGILDANISETHMFKNFHFVGYF